MILVTIVYWLTGENIYICKEDFVSRICLLQLPFMVSVVRVSVITEAECCIKAVIFPNLLIKLELRPSTRARAR